MSGSRLLAMLAPALYSAGCAGMQSMTDARGPQAERIAGLWWFFLIVCGLVFLAVTIALFLALFRRDRRPLEGEPRDGEPAKFRVVAIATGITVVILLAFLTYSVFVGNAMSKLPTADQRPITVEVVGHQWWWQIRYVDAQASRSFETANELRIPVGRPVIIRATSRDVIHSFWVPNLHGKIDLVPGKVNTIWIQADQPGEFRGQCAEFCGLQHALMAFMVVAEPEDRFEAWAEASRQPAPEPQDAMTTRGQRGVPAGAVRHVPHDPGHRGVGACRAGPDAHRQPEDAGRRHAPNNRGNLAAGFSIRSTPSRATSCRRPACRRATCRRWSPISSPAVAEASVPSPDQPRADATGHAAILQRTWESPGGFLGWFSQVNHRDIGRRFIVTAFVFFLLGGIEALLMRLQLAVPENTLIDPDLYRQLFTMHGTTMMFFFAVPVMEGFAMYLVPLMIGTRDMAFPRLNAFGYYVYLIAGVVLYGAFFLGMAPTPAGSTTCRCRCGPEFSPGCGSTSGRR
jgi:cytochrome c oxidase subunit II